MLEQEAVESRGDYRAMRDALKTEFGWYGGWGHHQREASHGDR